MVLTTQLMGSFCATQIMEDFCTRNGLESPVYTALPIDIVDCTNSGKIQLFIGQVGLILTFMSTIVYLGVFIITAFCSFFQVIIPSLRLQYITPRYYSTAEEAKVGAAETAVYNLHYNQMQLAMTERKFFSLPFKLLQERHFARW